MIGTIVWGAISLLLVILVIFVIFRYLFRHNKADHIYAPFDEATSGTRPEMDGRNPISQTREKVQQEQKYNEQTEQKKSDLK